MYTGLYRKMFEEDKRYIKNMTEYCRSNKLRLLMITHHPPTYKALNGCKKRDRFISLYASNLEYLFRDVSMWICGHVHNNFDFYVDKCRIVGNQKGKPKDKITDYSNTFAVSI